MAHPQPQMLCKEIYDTCSDRKMTDKNDHTFANLAYFSVHHSVIWWFAWEKLFLPLTLLLDRQRQHRQWLLVGFGLRLVRDESHFNRA